MKLHSRIHVFFLLMPALCFAQAAQRNHPGQFDADVPIPTATGVLARHDAAAIAELKAHKGAIGAESWTGMQATGTITYGNDPTSYSATLMNLGSDKFRLDTQTDKGQESIRIHGHIEKHRAPDGRISRLSVDTAIAGIFPFQIPRNAEENNNRVAFLDRGLVTIGGTLLHRITYETSLLDIPLDSRVQPTTAVDMYFDATTHLLLKTAAFLRLSPGHPSTFLTITTYGDYRSVNGTLVPFRYSETVEGELTQTLQLSIVTLAPALDSASFDF